MPPEYTRNLRKCFCQCRTTTLNPTLWAEFLKHPRYLIHWSCRIKNTRTKMSRHPRSLEVVLKKWNGFSRSIEVKPKIKTRKMKSLSTQRTAAFRVRTKDPWIFSNWHFTSSVHFIKSTWPISRLSPQKTINREHSVLARTIATCRSILFSPRFYSGKRWPKSPCLSPSEKFLKNSKNVFGTKMNRQTPLQQIILADTTIYFSLTKVTQTDSKGGILTWR